MNKNGSDVKNDYQILKVLPAKTMPGGRAHSNSKSLLLRCGRKSERLLLWDDLSLDESSLSDLGSDLDVSLVGLLHLRLDILLGELGELLAQAHGGLDPDADDGEEADGEAGGGGREGAKAQNHELLNERATGLSERVANDIDSGLALDLGLLVKRNVRHLLARIEQGVLGRLAEDILGGTHQDGSEEGGHAKSSDGWRQGVREEHQGEEGNSSDKEHDWGDQSSGAPSELSEDEPGHKHHSKGNNSSVSGEVTHEGAVVVGVGELSLDLGLP